MKKRKNFDSIHINNRASQQCKFRRNITKSTKSGRTTRKSSLINLTCLVLICRELALKKIILLQKMLKL